MRARINERTEGASKLREHLDRYHGDGQTRRVPTPPGTLDFDDDFILFPTELTALVETITFLSNLNIKTTPDIRNDPASQMRELVWVMHILRHQPELPLDAAKVQLSTQTPVKDAIDWALLLDHAADQKPAMDLDLQGNGSRFLSESRVARSIAACSIGMSSNSCHVEQLKTRAPDISNNVEIASPTLPEALLAADSAGDTSALHGPPNQPRPIPHRGRGKRLPADDPDPTNLLSGTTGFLPSSLIEDLTIFKPSVRDENSTLWSLCKAIWNWGLTPIGSDQLFDTKITTTARGRLRPTRHPILSFSFPQLDTPPVSVNEDEPWISDQDLTPGLDKENGFEPSAKMRMRFGFGSNSNPLSTDPGPAKPSSWSIADIWTFGLRVSRFVFSGPSEAIHPRRKGGLPVMVR